MMTRQTERLSVRERSVLSVSREKTRQVQARAEARAHKLTNNLLNPSEIRSRDHKVKLRVFFVERDKGLSEL
jgi:hypothetical protein